MAGRPRGAPHEIWEFDWRGTLSTFLSRADLVTPGTGGMSVSEDWRAMPEFRLPPPAGFGRDPLWMIEEADLGERLRYDPAPSEANPEHGLIGPASPMSVRDYERALEDTCDRWKIVNVEDVRQ